MFYVKRDLTGKVIAVSTEKVEAHGFTEELPPKHPLIVEFLFDARGVDDEDLSRYAADLYELRLSDLALVRVIEDVISLLLEKNIVKITEFPVQAIRRLQHREKIREKLRQMGSNLFNNDTGSAHLDLDDSGK